MVETNQPSQDLLSFNVISVPDNSFV